MGTLQGGLQKTLKRELTKFLKPNWMAKCLVKRKKNFHEELKKNGNMKYIITPKGHGVIRGRRDLLNDHKGHGDLCGQFDLVYDPKRSRGH